LLSDALTRRLRAARFRPTALLVPVPESKPLLERAGVVSRTDLPPHVTLIFPFRPTAGMTSALQAELRGLFAEFEAFAFRLARVGRFPTALYLMPEPAAPFHALIEALVARWPECPPYGGAFEQVIPHLTVVEGPEPEGLAARIGALLPVEAQTHEVWLIRPDRSGSWVPLDRFPLSRPRPE
jgi:2'-5' RNA ligase